LRSLPIPFCLDPLLRVKVYLNGEFLGTHDSGYTPFGFSLAPGTLRVGEEEGANTLVVFADATNPDSWWCAKTYGSKYTSASEAS